MAKKTKTFDTSQAFYAQLLYFYRRNRGKIRSRYNDLTKKLLAYNDVNENTSAFLRKPQFEAFEMYVFIKEFMDNMQVYEMFDNWVNRKGKFSDESYYTIHGDGEIDLFDVSNIKQNKTVFSSRHCCI